MNVQKSLIALSIQLLISWSALDAAPFVYVANDGSSSFSVIDEANENAIAGSPFAVPDYANLVAVAISPDNSTAYMIDQANGTLIAIDIASNNILSTTSLNLMPIICQSHFMITPYASAIAINGSTAYIGISGSNNGQLYLMPVDISDPSAPILGTPILLLQSGIPTNCVTFQINDIVIYNNIAYITSSDPLHGYEYAYDYLYGHADPILNTINLTTLAQNYLGLPSSDPIGIAIASNMNTAYVVYSDLDSVQAIDLATLTFVGNQIPVDISPTGIAITSDNHYAYVANSGNNDVSVIDLTLATPSVVATIPIGNSPSMSGQSIIFSADNKTAYVACNSQGIVPIDVATQSVGAPILAGGDAAYALATTLTYAPSAATGVRRCNVFLLQTARILTITWSASITPGVTSYNIYNGTTLVGTVPATCPLTFNALIPNCDTGNNFFVSAVSAFGGESALTPVVVQ